MDDPRIYRDTACFSDRQWFIAGMEKLSFSTKADAENAVKAWNYGNLCGRRELAEAVRDCIDRNGVE